MALGATRASVLWLVLREGNVAGDDGSLIWLRGGRFAVGRLLSRMLFGVGAGDPAQRRGRGADACRRSHCWPVICRPVGDSGGSAGGAAGGVNAESGGDTNPLGADDSAVRDRRGGSAPAYGAYSVGDGAVRIANAALDAGFEPHPLLTMIHIVPGLLFVTLGPLQFVPKLRARRPGVHRWTGRVVLASGIVIGATALVMSPQMAIGGANETAATMLFATLFLFALGRAFAAILRGRVALHREWMIRAFAIGLAVSFVRPIVGVFFATSRITHLAPYDFFGNAFWLGFTIRSIAAEIWINYTWQPIASFEARGVITAGLDGITRRRRRVVFPSPAGRAVPVKIGFSASAQT